MKNIKQIGFSIVLMALFTACGGGGGDSTATAPSATTMATNTPYKMSTSGVITKTSTDANVTVSTNLDTNVTIATLLGGSATCTGCTP